MNALTDMDWGWWPLLKHRPPQEQRIDAGVLLKITPFFGTITGVLIALATHRANNAATLTICIAAGWIAFFILYRLTFAIAWNYRAKQLKKLASARN